MTEYNRQHPRARVRSRAGAAAISVPDTSAPAPAAELVPGADSMPSLADAQREVLRLEDYFLRRYLLESPATVSCTFGGGQQAEHTFEGDQRDAFNGVAIINPAAVTVYVGFQVGAAIGSPVQVPPGSFMALPRRYANLSLAVSAQDSAGPLTLPIVAMRLRIPPSPEAGPLGGALAGAQTAFNPGSIVTVGTLGVANAIAANPDRRELMVVNAGANWVTLALGPLIPVMYAGIPLAPNGGAWQDNVWGGPVSMVAAVNGTTVSVTEI